MQRQHRADPDSTVGSRLVIKSSMRKGKIGSRG